MEHKHNIHNELEQVSPLLAQLKKEQPQAPQQDVPPRYFEQLTSEVLHEARRKPAPPPFWQKLELLLDRVFNRPRYVVSLATLVAVLAFTAYLFGVFDSAPESPAVPSLVDAQPDATLTNEYLADHLGLYDMTTNEDMLAYLNATDAMQNQAPDSEATPEEALDQELLEDYIFDNVDEQIILEEML